jgi:hypothetical protein
MIPKFSPFLPASETGRWLAAREWAAEFCANQRAQGYEPEAVVADITGCYPDHPINWNEAQFICIDAVMCHQSTHEGGEDE